ncbi:hypothetical protein RIF29_35679 [Crotalaria pallida]|uniref:J domain-containing protein n=1 Tax=Crotalaria pallida TaxID=3830 RepID=A0AAN9HY33_CROPI
MEAMWFGGLRCVLKSRGWMRVWLDVLRWCWGGCEQGGGGRRCCWVIGVRCCWSGGGLTSWVWWLLGGPRVGVEGDAAGCGVGAASLEEEGGGVSWEEEEDGLKMKPDTEGSLSSSSYYDILGVSSNSSIHEIRRAYRKLAMQWHPDKWTRTPSLLGEAKRKFQLIQEAYSVLSDPKKRTMYDVVLYDSQEEEDEGISDFVEEMVSLMEQVRREEKVYGWEELQSMFMEMAQGFESSNNSMMYCEGTSSVLDESRCSKRTRLDTKVAGNQGSHFQVPTFNLYETRGCCN